MKLAPLAIFGDTALELPLLLWLGIALLVAGLLIAFMGHRPRRSRRPPPEPDVLPDAAGAKDPNPR